MFFGLSNKILLIEKLIDDEEIDIELLQETELVPLNNGDLLSLEHFAIETEVKKSTVAILFISFPNYIIQ